MNKNNNVIFGVILLVISVLALVQTFVDINFGALSILFLGAAFLMLYRTKRKSWALILGTYMLYIGLGTFFSFFGLNIPFGVAIGSGFFVVPGAIFLVLFFTKNKTGLLVPASFLIWFGLYILTSSLTSFAASKGISIFNGISNLNLFIIYLGFAMLMVFLLGKSTVSILYAYIGSSLIALSALKLLFSSIFKTSFSGNSSVTAIVSLVLIGVSVYMIFFQKRK